MGSLISIKNLLAKAQSAGLWLTFDGELLRIRGARKATAIAKELLDRKREVIEFLGTVSEPPGGGAENVGIIESPLLVTAERIRLYRQSYHPVPDPPAVGDQLSQHDANIETHDSALFDVNVEVTFYDGQRLRIPQQSTPDGWTSPF